MKVQAHIGLLYFVKKMIIFFNKKIKIYFDSFLVEHIPEEIKEFIKKFHGNKNIKTNIFRIQ